MKSFWILALLILVFSVDISAQELTKKDVEQVFRDANHGNPKAQAYLGGMFLQGNGVPLDPVETVKWWRKAAEQGNVFAQVNLGRMYSRGEGVSMDYDEAAKWFRKAVEQGDENAIKELSVAMQWQKYYAKLARTRKAVIQGSAQGAYKLGNMFHYGDKSTKNHAEAEKWYRKAAELGSSEAQYNSMFKFFATN